MFETKKTLIVVYKDELLMNQLKKMVETDDDDEQSVVGTRDGSINIVSWTEEVWLGNKKAGNIQGKILFLGDIKGTDKLIPVIDVKFDEYGVKFGWAGNQAIVYADPKELTADEDYDAFLEKLSLLSVPEILIPTKENASFVETNQETSSEVLTDKVTETSPEQTNNEIVETEKNNIKKLGIFKVVKKAVSLGTDALEKVGTQVVSKSVELFQRRLLVKQQMLFYGVVNLYNYGLEEFMNI